MVAAATSESRSPLRPAEVAPAGGDGASPEPEDREVLARLLLSRSREERAGTLLESLGGLSGLLQVDRAVLQAQGLSCAETASVLATIELARRLQPAPSCREILEDPQAAGRYLFVRHASPSQEVFGAVYFDAEERHAGEQVLFRGTRTGCSVSVRRILSEAARRSAPSLLVFHNHPSGNLTPSRADLHFTESLVMACRAIGLVLIDHLILGVGRCLSLRRRSKDWTDFDPGFRLWQASPQRINWCSHSSNTQTGRIPP